MLEVEPTGGGCRTATGSGRNSNEAVAGATSKVFARWLHYRYAHRTAIAARESRFTARYRRAQLLIVVPLPGSNLRQVAVMPYCWEGNRRSGVAVAMCHSHRRHFDLSTCGLEALTRDGAWRCLPLHIRHDG